VPSSAPDSQAFAASSAGQILGQAYDALAALQLSGALDEAEKAPLEALISVLQQKVKG